MATKSGGGFEFPPSFIGNVDSADVIQKQFIEAPMAAAREPAMAAAIEVLKFMSAIPDALVASQDREVKRIARAHKGKDRAVTSAEASLERAKQMKAVVDLGLTRVQRMLAVASDRSAAFHGFVSDASMKPLHGLTVRLTAAEGQAGGHLSAKTAEDGYFRIPFGTDKTTTRPVTAVEVGTTIDATTGGGAEVSASVEILDSKSVVYRDPEPLAIGSGPVYREYVIDPHGQR
jgi:hypothetical protein